MMKKLWILLFIMISSLNASIGKITALRGEAILLHANERIPVRVGTTLEEHDQIQTEKNCKLQIVFEDKTVISLGHNTTFKIDAYLNDDKKPQARFSVGKGFFKSITGKIGKIAPKRFKIKTANATIGVRGTTIVAEVSKQRDIIACTSGQIVVQTERGSMVVNAGERTIVEQMKMPKQPQKLNHVLLKEIDAKTDTTKEVLPTQAFNEEKAMLQEELDLADVKTSDDFSPWEEQGLHKLEDIEHVLGERRPSYKGKVTEGSTSFGAIDRERSDVELGFDLGEGSAKGKIHIEDAKDQVHDIEISGKIRGNGAFDFNSNNGYSGGGKGALSGATLEHANGDFGFSDIDLSGRVNQISGKFETTKQ
jgi:hypothetical protein